MMTTSFLHLSNRRTPSGDLVVDGVRFQSHSVGVLQYALISEDGRIIVRHKKLTYWASTIPGGDLKSPSGKLSSFRTQEAAIRAAIAALRKHGIDNG